MTMTHKYVFDVALVGQCQGRRRRRQLSLSVLRVEGLTFPPRFCLSLLLLQLAHSLAHSLTHSNALAAAESK